MKNNKINININYALFTYILVNLVVFIGAFNYIAKNFIVTEKGVSSILFGGLLTLVMLHYVINEIVRCNPLEIKEIKK